MESIKSRDGDSQIRMSSAPDRFSSKVFSAARNFRMDQMFKYEEYKMWHYDNIFEFESKEIENLIEESINDQLPAEFMFRFIPFEDEMIFIKDKTMQRLVFYSQTHDFTNQEIQSIQEFKMFTKIEGYLIPDRDEEVLRNLYGRRMDNKAAFNAMKEKQEYRDKIFPIKIGSKTKILIESGVLYIYGRDKNLRPIIVIQAEKMLVLPKEITNQDIIDFLILVNEYVQKYMMIEGRIENTILIVDCKNLGVFNMPYKMIQAVLSVLQMQYKCKTKIVYCLNCPTTFSVAWKVIRAFLEVNTVKKVQIESSNTCKALQEMVLDEQLQTRFGGTAPDVVDKFWPPKQPSKNYGVENQSIEGSAPKDKLSIKKAKTKNKFAEMGAIDEEEEEAQPEPVASKPKLDARANKRKQKREENKH